MKRYTSLAILVLAYATSAEASPSVEEQLLDLYCTAIHDLAKVTMGLRQLEVAAAEMSANNQGTHGAFIVKEAFKRDLATGVHLHELYTAQQTAN